MGVDLVIGFKMSRELTEDELTRLNKRINYFLRAEKPYNVVTKDNPWIEREEGEFLYDIDAYSRYWSEDYKEFADITEDMLKLQCVRARYPEAKFYMGGDCSESIQELSFEQQTDYLNRWFRYDLKEPNA
jgi:hypothetical protein